MRTLRMAPHVTQLTSMVLRAFDMPSPRHQFLHRRVDSLVAVSIPLREKPVIRQQVIYFLKADKDDG